MEINLTIHLSACFIPYCENSTIYDLIKHRCYEMLLNINEPKIWIFNTLSLTEVEEYKQDDDHMQVISVSHTQSIYLWSIHFCMEVQITILMWHSKQWKVVVFIGRADNISTSITEVK